MGVSVAIDLLVDMSRLLSKGGRLGLITVVTSDQGHDSNTERSRPGYWQYVESSSD